MVTRTVPWANYLLTIIIEKFIPKLYRNFVTMNLKLTSKHKKYLENISLFLRNRPRSSVTDILDKENKENNNNTFMLCLR